MPIRDRITWGPHNPFSDPRLAQLDGLVRSIRQKRMPPNVKGNRVFKNELLDLPVKPPGYYLEFDVIPTVGGQNRGSLRIVLGKAGAALGEVYITGNHYRDFRQVLHLPP